MNGILHEYVTPTTIVDTMRLALWQKSDAINFMVAMNNRPESPGNWADVNLTGVIEPSSLSANFTQKDFNDKIGFELGADASWLDSVIYVHVKYFSVTKKNEATSFFGHGENWRSWRS